MALCNKSLNFVQNWCGNNLRLDRVVADSHKSARESDPFLCKSYIQILKDCHILQNWRFFHSLVSMTNHRMGELKKGILRYHMVPMHWSGAPITMPFIQSLEDPIGCKGFQVAGPWSYWEKGKGFWKPNYYNWVYECASHVILPRCTLSLHHFIHFVGNRRAKGEIEGPWYEIYWGGSWLM